jgi:hypothetical protein
MIHIYKHVGVSEGLTSVLSVTYTKSSLTILSYPLRGRPCGQGAKLPMSQENTRNPVSQRIPDGAE